MSIRSMGDLWSRQGFSSINVDQCVLLRQAFVGKEPHRPELGYRPEIDSYEAFCKKWLEGIPHDGALPAVEHVSELMEPIPALRHFSVTSIMCDINTLAVTEITPHESVWRWPYYQFAYTIYWALLFHESNAMLENPEFLAKKILRLWTCLYARYLDKTFIDYDRGKELKLLIAALFERTLGAQYDARLQTQCWQDNIANRRGLNRRQQIARTGIFSSALDALQAKWQNMILLSVPK